MREEANAETAWHKSWISSALEEGILMDVLNMVGKCRGTHEPGERPGGINQKYTVQPSLTENPLVRKANIENKI